MKLLAPSLILATSLIIVACDNNDQATAVEVKKEPVAKTQAPTTKTSDEAVKGPEVEYDPESAIIALQYYIEEARIGSAYAQLSVGESYMDGKIIPVNYVEAYAWLVTAEYQEVTEATEIKELAWSKMSEEEQQYAIALGEYYTSNYAKLLN